MDERIEEKTVRPRWRDPSRTRQEGTGMRTSPASTVIEPPTPEEWREAILETLPEPTE
ncbi:hypothetical protein [Nocardioides sp. SYSU D00038]|uniref:hypothetical protein n=1 Tax=Nocardioides sp. SYSU D00038 TaxID=2812554 RepID=UPI001967B656|nr:hypothetical protein [Nocardioides sp. SYSU D00038]